MRLVSIYVRQISLNSRMLKRDISMGGRFACCPGMVPPHALGKGGFCVIDEVCLDCA